MLPLLAVSTGAWAAAGLAALAVLALLAWAGRLKLFGPVLFYEVVRVARQGRHFWLRAAYAVGLFLLLVWVWAFRAGSVAYRDARPEDLTALAESFFWLYVSVQFFAAALLTPG